MARYSETINCSLPVSVRWALREQTLRFNGYEVVYKDEDEIIARSETNYEKLHVTIVGAGVHVSSQGIFPGPRRKRVQDFVNWFGREIKRLTPEQQQKLAAEANKHVVTDEYAPPSKLPSPPPEQKSTLFYALITVLLLSILAGFLYERLRFLENNWSFVLLLSIGPAIGYGVRYAASFGNYSRISALRIVVITGTLAVGIWAFQYDYFQGLLSGKTNGQLIFFVAGCFIVPTIIGITILKEGVQKVHKGAIPEEVLRFAIYIAQKGNDEATLRFELSKRGWVLENDQNKVIDALRAHQQIQQVDKHTALKR